MATLSPTRYFEVALDLIAREGFESFTIAKLCQALGVTIGSFYHHFRSGRVFVQALYGYWETEHALRLVDQARSEPDPIARFELLKQLAADLPHGAEASIRAWSRSHPDAAEVQHRVDAARVAVVADTLRDLGVPAERAQLLATLSVAVLVGGQGMGHAGDEDRAQLVRMFDELQGWLVAQAASPAGNGATRSRARPKPAGRRGPGR